MSKELRHKDPAAKLSRTEDNAVDRHYITGGSNNDIPVYDSSNAKLVGKTPAEILAILLTTGDYKEIHADMDHSTIRALGKPTDVHRGVFNGFSLPVYSNDNEEIFLEVHVPHDWDASSDLIIKTYGYLASANTSKNFKLRLQWENVTGGTDTYPATDNDVDVQTATGTASQYMSFEITFTIDYDIDGSGNEIDGGDQIGFVLQRIAASANEITGEFVVTDVTLKYKRSLLGSTT